jgi:hypothetical protein
MKHSMKTFLVASALTGTMALSAQAAPIVSNGSFEFGSGIGDRGQNFATLGDAGQLDWDIYQSGEVTDWSTDTNGIEIQTDRTLPANGGPDIDAQDGDNYVELDTTSNSSISQMVTLTGGRYLLSFYFSPRVNSPVSSTNSPTTNGISYGLDGLFSLLADGPSIIPDVPFGEWTLFTFEFVADAGTYELFFDATGRPNSVGGLLDNVAITAVPVPAGGLLLLGGLAGLAALRRRKATAA